LNDGKRSDGWGLLPSRIAAAAGVVPEAKVC